MLAPSRGGPVPALCFSLNAKSSSSSSFFSFFGALSGLTFPPAEHKHVDRDVLFDHDGGGAGAGAGVKTFSAVSAHLWGVFRECEPLGLFEIWVVEALMF